jgi:exonuclease III
MSHPFVPHGALLKVVSLNIEGDKHWGRIHPFLQEHQPDVLCLQEVYESDLYNLTGFGSMYYLHHYVPMMKIDGKVLGIAILAKEQNVKHRTLYVQRQRKIIERQRILQPDGYPLTDHRTVQYAVQAITIRGVRILNTHLMVTHQGESTPDQRAMAEQMIAFTQEQAKRYGNVLFCGDTNAPRGKETWAKFTQGGLIDNIPPTITTTLDRALHVYGDDPSFNDFVVDAMFSIGLTITDVQVISGVSDHCAILALVSRI